MTRARLLKPSFFVNDELAEIESLGRLLFQALWCIADRDGRLVDAPKRIKVQALPYDDCDVDGLLNQLDDRGFIQRYTADGEHYIQVVNFSKHQHPHMKEPESTIPALGSHGASTVLESDENDTDPAESLTLNPIPRSLNPIPESETVARVRARPVAIAHRPESAAIERLMDALKALPGWPKTLALSTLRAKVEQWQTAYAGVSFEDELRCMDSWFLSHPQRKANTAFVENWLRKAAKDAREERLHPGANGHSGGGGPGPQVRAAGRVAGLLEYDAADPTGERLKAELRSFGVVPG